MGPEAAQAGASLTEAEEVLRPGLWGLLIPSLPPTSGPTPLGCLENPAPAQLTSSCVMESVVMRTGSSRLGSGV